MSSDARCQPRLDEARGGLHKGLSFKSDDSSKMRNFIKSGMLGIPDIFVYSEVESHLLLYLICSAS